MYMCIYKNIIIIIKVEEKLCMYVCIYVCIKCGSKKIIYALDDHQSLAYAINRPTFGLLIT